MLPRLEDDTPNVEAPLAKLEELARLRQRMAALDQLIAAKAPPRERPWHKLARPNQLPPEGDWSVALFLAGRGFGKSRLAAEWIAEQAALAPNSEWAIVAPTWRDCKKNCIDAVVSAMLPGELDSLNASDLLIRFTNGSKVWGYSSDGFNRLRGSNLSGAWCDEIAVYASPDELFYEALMPALRIGESPRLLITTTPRPIRFLRELVARDDGSVVTIKGSTWDNAANLSKAALTELRRRFEGTRTGRQELLGELLTETAGAYWSLDLLDRTRVKEAPAMTRIVVAVDPATTSGEKSDMTGIVVAGRGIDGHLYVLEDLTMKGTPHACMAKAVSTYHRWQADRIVAEVNNGGDYLEGVLRAVDENVPYTTVRATRGKSVRAEPVAALWEQGRGHIVGCLPELEDQMAACIPPDANGKDRKSKEPDDRLDACFVAGTPVLTARGETPIEQVVPGDLAWTRAGWKPVIRSECTRRDAEVMTVELSNGRHLTGTPNHRVWTENKGWSRLDTLVSGDILDGWMSPPSQSNSTGSLTPGTPEGSSEHIGFTTELHGARTACTELYGGLPIQGSGFHGAGTSTTRTTTRSITPLTISKRSAQSSTINVTLTSALRMCWPLFALTPNASGRWHPNGMAVLKASRGTASTASALGKAGSTSPATVTAAARSTGARSASSSDRGTAHGHVSPGSTTGRTAISDAFRVQDAARSSGSPITGLFPRRAAVSVRGSYAEPVRQNVYDLMVAERHEFVAAGVVVHNCIWAATELAVGASAMNYLMQISKMCGKCDTPNTKRSFLCSACGAQLPDAEAA